MLVPLTDSVRVLRAAVVARDARTPRPPGLHLSQIVDDYAETLGWTEKDEGRTLGDAEVFWEFGNAWEDRYGEALGLAYGGRKPEPVQCEGIWCSADWQRPLGAIDEIKLGWISSRQGAEHPKVKKFTMQLLGYLYAYGQRRGYLHVGYVRGNYKDKLVDLQSWKWMGSQDDIVANWRRVVRHAKDRGWL